MGLGKEPNCGISDFPDNATFREMGVNTGLVGQTWGGGSPL